MRPGAPLMAILPVAALLISGCGGGGGEETTVASVPTVEESPSLSKQELIQQGDAICAEVNAAVGTVDASETETADRVSQAADLYGGMVERLKDLGTPEDDAGYAEFTEAADALAQAEADAQLASERGDEAALNEAESEAEAALEAFEEAAGSYGFEDCSEAPRAPSVVSPAGGGAEEEGEEVEVPAEVEEEQEVPVEEVPAEEVPAEEGGAGGTEGGGTGAGGGEEGGGGGSGGIGPG